jgi:hypothetical protein
VEDPELVEREAERGAEHQADDVRRDVVGEGRREAEHVVRDEQAQQPDPHAAEGDGEELEALAQRLSGGAPRLAERPQPVAEPDHDDRDEARRQLREQGARRDVVRREDGEPERVEDTEVDDEPAEAHEAVADELTEQTVHAGPLEIGQDGRRASRRT